MWSDSAIGSPWRLEGVVRCEMWLVPSMNGA